MKNRIYCLFFVLFFFQFLACKRNYSKGLNSVLQNEWIFSSIQNTKTQQVISYPENFTRKESIKFTDTELSFKGLCNVGSGRYTISGERLNLTDFVATQKACIESDYNNWEEYMIKNFVDSYAFKISGKTLIVYSKGEYNLIFTIRSQQ